MSDFDKAFEIVVGLEGVYSNDPRDPGGETKYGVSKRAYPGLDIKNLTIEQAKEIYERDYWSAAEAYPWPMSLYVFDGAVNQGVAATLSMLERAKDEPHRFLAERALRYARTQNFQIYGRGWFNRLFSITLRA